MQLFKHFPNELPGQRRDDPLLAFFLALGCLEFLTAAFIPLFIGADPQDAVQKLAIFLFTIAIALCLLVFAIQAYRGKISNGFEAAYAKHPNLWMYITLVLAIAGLIALMVHPSLFRRFGSYFEELRPLLVVLCFFPAQLSLKWVIAERQPIDKLLLRYALVGLGALLLLVGFITTSRLGITPDTLFSKLAGIPITNVQFMGVLLIATLSCGGIALLFRSKNNWGDLALILGIYLCAALIWAGTPMLRDFFSIRPRWPYYQPFPYSDARVHDLGALSILHGWGINFGEYTDKPLYMVFLAILHGIAGDDYNLLTQLQACFLALIPVALYWFGKSFHSRFFGVVIAFIVIIRQQNTILLSDIVYNVNPRLLSTEAPTLLGLVVFTWLVFRWLDKRDSHPWIALAAGGAIGAVSLIRMNPLALFPVILFFALFVFWRQKRSKWMLELAVFTLGFAILVTPWILTGSNANGKPYLLIKFQDVINARYEPNSNGTKPIPVAATQIPSSPAPQAPPPSAPQQDTPPAATATQPANPLIDIRQFPGFVVNHFFYNVVASFLELPDSIASTDQVLVSLVTRPYWLKAETGHWSGQIDAKQIPFMLLNICLIAIGLGWSWKRWRWTGLTPLLVFLVYDLALSLARNSGSRYLVPMDWIPFFYFALGVVSMLGFLPEQLKKKLGIQPVEAIALPAPAKFNWRAVLIVAIIITTASLIPIVDNMLPVDTALCNNDSLQDVVSHMPGASLAQNITFVKGEVLYPSIQDTTLTFTLLTCRRPIPLTVKNFKTRVGNGQVIIMGLSDLGPNPETEMMIAPGDETRQPQLLWVRIRKGVGD